MASAISVSSMTPTRIVFGIIALAVVATLIYVTMNESAPLQARPVMLEKKMISPVQPQSEAEIRPLAVILREPAADVTPTSPVATPTGSAPPLTSEERQNRIAETQKVMQAALHEQRLLVPLIALSLGVTPATREFSEFFRAHLNVDGGFSVGNVTPSSVADSAGLAFRDLILSIGGQPAGSHEDVSRQLATFKRGDRTTLIVLREGSTLTLEMTFGRRVESTGKPSMFPYGVQTGYPLDALMANLRLATGYPVAGVTENSPAKLAGIEPLDILYAIDGHQVNSSHLMTLFKEATPGASIRVDLVRRGALQTVFVILAELRKEADRSLK